MNGRFKTPLFVFALTSLVGTPLSAETTLHSYAFGKAFRVTITDDAIAKSPTWKEDSENLPLSAKKAQQLATELKDSLVKDSNEYKWKLKALELHPARGSKWYWLVRYEAEFQRGFSSGEPIQLRLVVLMDGTVIKPVIGGSSD